MGVGIDGAGQHQLADGVYLLGPRAGNLLGHGDNLAVLHRQIGLKAAGRSD